MTLRNAFENMATEARQITANALTTAANAILQGISDKVATDATLGNVATESTLKRLLGNLTFARTGSDQLRTVVDSGTVAISGTPAVTVSSGTIAISSGTINTVQSSAISWGTNGAYPTYYGTGAPGSMDTREQQRFTNRVVVTQARQRWSIT